MNIVKAISNLFTDKVPTWVDYHVPPARSLSDQDKDVYQKYKEICNRLVHLLDKHNLGRFYKVEFFFYESEELFSQLPENRFTIRRVKTPDGIYEGETVAVLENEWLKIQGHALKTNEPLLSIIHDLCRLASLTSNFHGLKETEKRLKRYYDSNYVRELKKQGLKL